MKHCNKLKGIIKAGMTFGGIKKETSMKKSMLMICFTLFLIAICASLPSIHASADTYSYDEMGRIKEAVHDDGSKTSMSMTGS